MPVYKILLPPLMTDRLIEDGTVELTEEAAAPLLLTGTIAPLARAATGLTEGGTVELPPPLPDRLTEGGTVELTEEAATSLLPPGTIVPPAQAATKEAKTKKPASKPTE